jgi:hypothetical protein
MTIQWLLKDKKYRETKKSYMYSVYKSMMALIQDNNEWYGMALARSFYLDSELFGGTPPIGLAKAREKKS